MRQAKVSEDAGTLALRALVWTLAEPDRADRLLAVTGIEPESLRARLNDPAVLAATLQFLLGNEADLLACADELGVSPEALAGAADRLDS